MKCISLLIDISCGVPIIRLGLCAPHEISCNRLLMLMVIKFLGFIPALLSSHQPFFFYAKTFLILDFAIVR